MNFDLSVLNYDFKQKPLIIGGAAMEYYNLRKAGDDVDLMASAEDVAALIKLYPNRVKDLYGDLGVCPGRFEIWKTINLLTFDELKPGAIEFHNCLIISLEKLLLMKAEAMDKEKYLQDTKLIVKHLLDEQYKRYNGAKTENERLLQDAGHVQYIERRGPEV